ncbi:MAG: 3-isopropylmalate dehydratase small subunit [Spirochaetales bacterium]|nr:3-isopropylmalate dehydratase small subunit [Spirochaetales bacterium]MCF7939764.1 3-isopropylmalate dehydratase small subunit [Spirochaetales bacterium]
MKNYGEPITGCSGRAVPIRGDDVDTDRIIPARYLKSVSFSGLGDAVFYDERFDSRENPKKHPLNDPRFEDANIMLVNNNFGSGSSREHAPQAIARYGIDCIIGESFAEIFAGNSTVIGLPVCTMERERLLELMDRIEADPSVEVEIDLEAMELRAGGKKYKLSMPETRRSMLLDGSWDSLELLRKSKEAVEELIGKLDYRFA